MTCNRKIDFSIYNADVFFTLNADDIDGVSINGNNMQIQGKAFAFTAFSSTDTKIGNTPSLVSVSATATGNVSMVKSGETVNVTTDGALQDVETGSYLGTDKETQTYDTDVEQLDLTVDADKFIHKENKLKITCNDGSFEQQVKWWKKYSTATMSLGFLIQNCDKAVRYVWSTNSWFVDVDQNGNVTNTGCFARKAKITLTAYDAEGEIVAQSTVTVRFYKFNWQYRRLQSQEVVSDNMFRPAADPAATEPETLFSFVSAFFSKFFGFLKE